MDESRSNSYDQLWSIKDKSEAAQRVEAGLVSLVPAQPISNEIVFLSQSMYSFRRRCILAIACEVPVEHVDDSVGHALLAGRDAIKRSHVKKLHHRQMK